MNQKRASFLVAKGLVALAILALIQPELRAGCDGCATSSSRTPRRLGCDTCPYRPGSTPTLLDSGTFGFTPTVWSLWPGPLDPNTSYPNAAAPEPVKPPTMPPAGGESSDKPSPPKSEKPHEKPTSPYAALPAR